MSDAGLFCDFRLGRSQFHLDCRLQLTHIGRLALYGRSGSGKTTFLRCLAGLERPEGSLVVQGETLLDSSVHVPAHRRRMAYVFQDNRLFPHMTVARHLDWVLQLASAEPLRVHRDEIVEWFELGAMLDVYPQALSGGQQRRVALAQALLTQPRLLLLDEPLTGLDREARAEVLKGLQRAQKQLGIPMMYVTHDPDELHGWVEQVLYMEAGTIRQNQSEQSIERSTSVLGVDVLRYEAGLQMAEVAWGDQRIWIGLAAEWALKTRLFLRIHSQEIRLGALNTAPNLLRAQVVALERQGSVGELQVRLDLGKNRELVAPLRVDYVDTLSLSPGCSIGVHLGKIEVVPECDA